MSRKWKSTFWEWLAFVILCVSLFVNFFEDHVREEPAYKPPPKKMADNQ